mmetsp:Transcript_9466/g.12881  ORF Transcript_9466/g.12881 Transcript_9466/m.12881 type:complete len:80 (-) Transcript_9466:1034-1273(-)
MRVRLFLFRLFLIGGHKEDSAVPESEDLVEEKDPNDDEAEAEQFQQLELFMALTWVKQEEGPDSNDATLLDYHAIRRRG